MGLVWFVFVCLVGWLVGCLVVWFDCLVCFCLIVWFVFVWLFGLVVWLFGLVWFGLVCFCFGFCFCLVCLFVCLFVWFDCLVWFVFVCLCYPTLPPPGRSRGVTTFGVI